MRVLRVSIGVFTALLLSFLAFHEPAETAARAAAGTIQGQVTDHFGAAIPGVIVTAILTDTESVAGETATDRDGMFVFAGLDPGNYRIKVQPMFPFGEAEESLTVEATGVSGLKIGLGRGCSRASDKGGLQEKYLAETVRLAISDAFEKLGVPHAKGQTVLVSKANLNPAWLAPFQDLDVKFVPEGAPLPSKGIDRNQKMLRISDIRTAEGCSSISIGYVSPEGGDGSEESGFTLEFRKVGEKWLKRTVLEVIS